MKFKTTSVFEGWAKTDGKIGAYTNIQFVVAQKISKPTITTLSIAEVLLSQKLLKFY
jgi:hypothetical protein